MNTITRGAKLTFYSQKCIFLALVQKGERDENMHMKNLRTVCTVQAFMHFLCACQPSFLLACTLPFLRVYPSYLRACQLPICLHVCMTVCLLAWLPACLPACLAVCPPTFLNFLHVCVPSCMQQSKCQGRVTTDHAFHVSYCTN
jgi:hypothetical protein